MLVLDGERFVRLQENGVLDAIVRDLRSTLKKLLLIRAEGVKGAEKYGDLVVHWNSMMRENLGKKMPVVDLQPDDPSSLYYSSGTTGKPKGCLAPHRSWTNIQISSPFGGSRQIVRRGDPFPPPANPNLPQRCSLIAMPMYHGFGTVVTTQMVMQGGKCVYMWKFDAGLALKMIQDEKITALSGVPSMVTQVLEHPDLEKYDISSLEAVTSGGAPAAASLGDDIKKKVKVPVVGGNGFGLTELNSCIVNLMDDFQRLVTLGLVSGGRYPPLDHYPGTQPRSVFQLPFAKPRSCLLMAPTKCRRDRSANSGSDLRTKSSDTGGETMPMPRPFRTMDTIKQVTQPI